MGFSQLDVGWPAGAFRHGSMNIGGGAEGCQAMSVRMACDPGVCYHTHVALRRGARLLSCLWWSF